MGRKRWIGIATFGIAAAVGTPAMALGTDASVTGGASAGDPGVVQTTTSTSPPLSPDDPAPVPGRDGGTITVTGSGTVSVDPDTATVNLGAQADAATGAAALEQVNGAVADLTAALVAAGIPEEDIQTAGINLYSTTDDRGEVSGFQASISVTVTVRDIEAVGPTIDTAQQAAGAAFTIGGVSFSFDDPESVLEPARVDAVAEARRKAEQFAAAAGVELGDVLVITEGGATAPVLYAAQDFAGEAAPAAAATPISPGQLDLTATVSVTYRIAG